jgi:hypothetical protein
LRKYYVWHMEDALLDCASSSINTPIVWKTQFGYLSYLDRELMTSMRDDDFYYDVNLHDQKFKQYNQCLKLKELMNTNETLSVNNSTIGEIGEVEGEVVCEEPRSPNSYGSFKIFYKMNRLTKIQRNFTVQAGLPFGAMTHHTFSVNEKNQLKITNMRVPVAGSFVCYALNARGIGIFEFELFIRSGVGETFIYSLFVSVISMVVPSIIGLFICCWCEYEADKNYPMTPPCYPTPMAANTPPNFDFNDWMASYLPNIKIPDTIEKVKYHINSINHFSNFD